ncbi:zinc finger and SCAN domain-containing protein 2-like isoform X2 [Wyeomyia smithii]|uniref:zinc finger and SCAN domain-containing protein 2-like isoform X2 n=1 Tax=Wyeomyia smithii TaxID=174621 RepID=UPI002467C607|nr:zinc finger and SCAN domain-containing protein 2-like isoform X2 [Wyeomyia smithii]
MDIRRLASDQPDESLKMVEIDFQALCRICGALGENLTSVFGKRAADRLRERIGKYLQIEILAEDCLPTKVCDGCRETLDRFHDLFEKCHRTDEKFRTMMNAAEELKEMENDTRILTEEDEEELVDDEPNVPAETSKKLQQNENQNAEMDEQTEKKGELRYSISELGLKNEDSCDTRDYFEHQDDFYGEYQIMIEQFNVKSEVLESHASNLNRAPTIPLVKEVVDKGAIKIDGTVYYKCTECGKQMNSPYTYQAHLRIHSGERPFACPHCTKSFRISQGLSRHVHDVHEKLRSYRCDICGNSFGNKRNLTEHRYLHSNERNYACDRCEKSFKQKAALFVHKRSHEEKRPFVCPVCSSSFYTRSKLKLHETTHSLERDHVCSECGQDFRSKHNLNRHWKTHNVETSFQCAICGVRFKQNRYLLKHLRTQHRKEKTFITDTSTGSKRNLHDT